MPIVSGVVSWQCGAPLHGAFVNEKLPSSSRIERYTLFVDVVVESVNWPAEPWPTITVLKLTVDGSAESPGPDGYRQICVASSSAVAPAITANLQRLMPLNVDAGQFISSASLEPVLSVNMFPG